MKLLLLVAIFFCLVSSSKAEVSDSLLVVYAQDAVKSRMKDPSSVKFGDVYVKRKNGNQAICGTVNSKNSYGGYNGFQRFISAGKAEFTFFANDMADGEFEKSWEEYCS